MRVSTDFCGSEEESTLSNGKMAGSEKMKMKIVVLAAVVVALAASLVGQVAAAPLRHKKQAYRQRTMTTPPRRAQQGGGDYYEHLLDKVPFGSRRWWDIYQEQHGRGGG